MILHVRNTLGSIRNVTELSRGKFKDKEFGESFYRFITKDIETGDLLLNGLLNYIKASTPIKERSTVHTLVEQVLMKYRAQLEEKRIKTSKTFEKNLPETIIPDEHMQWPQRRPMGTSSFFDQILHSSEGRRWGSGLLREAWGDIEILVVFASDRKPVGQSGTAWEGIPSLQKDEALDLILRLVKEMVLRNQGMMKFETDEKKAKVIISLRFPVERRKVFFYEPISINPPTNPPFDSIPNTPFPQ